MKRLSTMLAVMMMLGLLLAACGGGASGGDPASVVKAAMDAVVAKQFDKISEYSCAAQKDKVATQLNPAAQLASQGIDEATSKQLLESLTITVADASYTNVSEAGDKAVVQMKGKMSMKFDREKLKGFVKELLKAQGLPEASDEQVAQVLDLVAAQLETGQDMDNKVDLVKENGKWVICPAE